MLAVKVEKKESKLQGALDYVGEYKGVKSVAVFDKEGLVIGHFGNADFDAEKFSPLAVLMIDNINSVLHRLDETPAGVVIVKTSQSWLTLARIGEMILAVNADIETDDLLRLRIGQATEMIKNHLNEKYPLLFK
jgi:predicted regulator of Ras-like GTPase activity (Roadblock/LC7/MglB family)